MAIGELVFANVLDKRMYDAQGEQGPPGLYVLSLPGRALPFVAYRAWKVPQGYVREEFRLIAPSGTVAYRWGPQPRWMRGSMDLTPEVDLVEDAFLREVGIYLVSFIVQNQVLGEIEVPVHLQAAPQQLPKDIEDGLKRSDVIWVGVEENGNPITIPAWFAYRQGKIYVLSQLEPGPEEQTIPGLPGAPELLVITRRKYRDTALNRFHATVRVLPAGPEFERAAALLADRRRSRVGPPTRSIERWRKTCIIAELTPVVAV